MLRAGDFLPTLSLGILGAVVSIGLLPLVPADAGSTPYGRLMAEPLPNVVFVGAIGFGAGFLIAAAWSLARRITAPRA